MCKIIRANPGGFDSLAFSRNSPVVFSDMKELYQPEWREKEGAEIVPRAFYVPLPPPSPLGDG